MASHTTPMRTSIIETVVLENWKVILPAVTVAFIGYWIMFLLPSFSNKVPSSTVYNNLLPAPFPACVCIRLKLATTSHGPISIHNTRFRSSVPGLPACIHLSPFVDSRLVSKKLFQSQDAGFGK